MDWLSYGAREYDPAIGRFFGVDPIAESFAHVTPYNYAENEPIANIDLHGLQKLSMHILGQLKIKRGSPTTVSGKVEIDIGNRGATTFTMNSSLGTYQGEYNPGEGFSSEYNENVDSEASSRIAFETDRPGGIVLPKWAVKKGLKIATDAFTPNSVEESFELSKEELQFNKSMRQLFANIKDLVDSDLVQGLYDYDGSKAEGVNSEGQTYKRKFTNIFRGKFEDFEFNNGGIYFNGRLVVSFTMQKCIENCEGENNNKDE